MRPVAFAPSHPPGIAPARPAPRIDHSTPVAAACVAKPATPSMNPTTRFVPAARRTSSPTERTSAGMRSVPRITPTAPPIAPMRSPNALPRSSLRRSRGRAVIGRRARSIPLQTRTAAIAAYSTVSDTSSASSAPTTAPTTDGGAIQATTCQSTRPSRTWRRPPAPADAAEMAMFVPAALAGLPVATKMSGRRSVPRTRPSIEPTYPATNEPAKARPSSQASRAAPRGRRARSRRVRGRREGRRAGSDT